MPAYQIALQMRSTHNIHIPFGAVDTVDRQWLRSIQANRILHLDGLNAVIPSPIYKARDLDRALETDGVAHEVGLVVQLHSKINTIDSQGLFSSYAVCRAVRGADIKKSLSHSDVAIHAVPGC
jgi:hypothetical protein